MYRPMPSGAAAAAAGGSQPRRARRVPGHARAQHEAERRQLAHRIPVGQRLLEPALGAHRPREVQHARAAAARTARSRPRPARRRPVPAPLRAAIVARSSDGGGDERAEVQRGELPGAVGRCPAIGAHAIDSQRPGRQRAEAGDRHAPPVARPREAPGRHQGETATSRPGPRCRPSARASRKVSAAEEGQHRRVRRSTATTAATAGLRDAERCHRPQACSAVGVPDRAPDQARGGQRLAIARCGPRPGLRSPPPPPRSIPRRK